MDFDNQNIVELDKNLSDDQRTEWNSIYASYRAGSLLTGRVIGMDTIGLSVLNPETGKNEKRQINCLVIISYRVKILIPETEVWYDGETGRPPHVLRSMTGAEIDYVITDIDREGECCTASRRKALNIRRKRFLKLTPREGKRVECQLIAIGRTRILCSAGGFDVTLLASDMSYANIADLRERFHSGDMKTAVVKSYDLESSQLRLSVKEAEPHPYDGVELRHPINSRRASVITGKYLGGVFCRLEENLDCLCTYSPRPVRRGFPYWRPSDCGYNQARGPKEKGVRKNCCKVVRHKKRGTATQNRTPQRKELSALYADFFHLSSLTGELFL